MSRRRSSARLSGIRVRLFRVVRGVKIYLVDGEKVRDRLSVDFTMGSHRYRDKFVPLNEVWIEKILSPHDREALVIHEMHERGLMSTRGWGYERAHDSANVQERRFRRARS
jgi:hypothetical protein